MKIKKIYSEEHNFGDIIYNKSTGIVYITLNAGIFGSTTLNLAQNSDGTYNIMKPYIDMNNQANVSRVGKTYLKKDSRGEVIPGITCATLGICSVYSTELKKNILDNSVALCIETHKFKEPKEINNKLVKVGWVTGQFKFDLNLDTLNKQSLTDLKIEEPKSTFEFEFEDTENNDIPF